VGVAVAVFDETPTGETTSELTLEFLTERVTVRELIRSRVYQEVQDYNVACAGVFHGLIQPSEAEPLRHGYRLRPGHSIDWERQYEQALKAFRGNGVIILVDDRQVEELDEEIELRTDTRVAFLRLVPLVGG
jgi:hypothetical protein